ncbi:hypothetical protein [Paenibacillus sp. UNC451MF]|uniref:hypothetical protein n=1 Tax=Paenibacillus sp. UNC451MF TaxID=1449063 RepID=UPI00048CF940|nr:hypothetical protein [Paenibacillus sp. UNC451MF]
MSEKIVHDDETTKKQSAGGASEAATPSSPLLVSRQGGSVGEKESSEQHSNVVDLEQYKAGQGQLISEEALVQEWQLNTGEREPLVKLIMVSSGFGGKRSYISRNTDIQCIAA